MMIDQMQEELISGVLKYVDDCQNLLDPFHGAGTSLIIAQKLGLTPIGIDINPLANLITYVKLYNYNIVDLINKTNALIDRIKQCQSFEIIEFKNIDKWFRNDIKIETKVDYLSEAEDYVFRNQAPSLLKEKNRRPFIYIIPAAATAILWDLFWAAAASAVISG